MSDTQTTPSFAQVLNDAIDSKLLELHTAMPGVIESYNAKTGQANIAPSFKRKFVGKDAEPLPVISNVPIVHMRTATASIRMPIAKGDKVLLIFSERSIDAWKQSGGLLDPKHNRFHDLSDAFAILGAYPGIEAFKASGAPEDLEFTNKLAKLLMKPNGKLMFGNGTVDLLSLVIELVGILKAATTPTGIGPQNFSPDVIPKLIAVENKLKQISG